MQRSFLFLWQHWSFFNAFEFKSTTDRPCRITNSSKNTFITIFSNGKQRLFLHLNSHQIHQFLRFSVFFQYIRVANYVRGSTHWKVKVKLFFITIEGFPPFFYLLLFNLCVGWPLLLHSLDLIFIELDFMLSAACSASPQFSSHCVHVTQNTRFSNNSQLDTCSLAITGGKYTITRLK